MPWEIAKAFDHSAPVSRTFVNKSKFKNIQNISFCLDINGKQVQVGNTKDMLFTIDKIIAYVSRFVSFKMGDLIFTGTPSGVGPIKIGDHLIASIEGEELLNFEIK